VFTLLDDDSELKYCEALEIENDSDIKEHTSLGPFVKSCHHSIMSTLTGLYIGLIHAQSGLKQTMLYNSPDLLTCYVYAMSKRIQTTIMRIVMLENSHRFISQLSN